VQTDAKKQEKKKCEPKRAKNSKNKVRAQLRRGEKQQNKIHHAYNFTHISLGAAATEGED